MTTVLVVEDGRSAYLLPAVRSLARAGHRVVTASPSPNPRLLASRSWSGWRPARLPEDDVDGFVADVAAAAAQTDSSVVFAADDIEVLALSARRDEVPAVFPHAAHDAVVRSVDKLELTRAALAVGLGVPRTVEATPAHVEAVDRPVVVKARLHWSPGSPGSSRHVVAARCDRPEQVRRRVAEITAAGAQPVLQEALDGEQIAVSVVVDADGEAAAWSQQRTVLAGLSGASCRAETTPVDEALLASTLSLLRHLGWTGLANLQFLRDPTGTPRLIDLNGRFYGSLALAIGAGADLPAVWAALALGQPVGRPQVSRPGVRFSAFAEDLRRARAQRRGGVLRDAASAVGYGIGAVHSTWSSEDPRPGLELLVELLARRAARLS